MRTWISLACFCSRKLHALSEIKNNTNPSEMPSTKNEVLKESLQFKVSEETKKTSLKEDDPSKSTNVGVGLDLAQESTLVEFLKANKDIFAWQPSDMTGVPRELAEHSLNVYHDVKPVKQSLRWFRMMKSAKQQPRNQPDQNQLDLSQRSSTLNGWKILYLYLKRTLLI